MTNFGSIDQQFFTQTQDQEQWAEAYQSWSRVVVYNLKGSIFSGVRLYILSLNGTKKMLKGDNYWEHHFGIFWHYVSHEKYHCSNRETHQPIRIMRWWFWNPIGNTPKNNQNNRTWTLENTPLKPINQSDRGGFQCSRPRYLFLVTSGVCCSGTC